MYYPFNIHCWVQFDNIWLRISSVLKKISVSIFFSFNVFIWFGTKEIRPHKMCWEVFPSPLFPERISVGLALLMLSLPSVHNGIHQLACSLPNGKVYITKQISRIWNNSDFIFLSQFDYWYVLIILYIDISSQMYWQTVVHNNPYYLCNIQRTCGDIPSSNFWHWQFGVTSFFFISLTRV